MAKTTGLGQGVGALFGNNADDEKFFECEITRIIPNQQQPRVYFDEDELNELSQSIKEKGVIQPLIVSKKTDDQYELIAGERRLRASKIAGLDTVPVVVQEVTSGDSMLELALIENIQRTDLNALEEAEAYKKLIERFGYTQEETAKRVGKKRTTVTNTLRLLLLPDFVKEDLYSGSLSEGHARALLRINDDISSIKDIRDQIIQKKLSVRQTEQLVRKIGKPSTSSKRITPKETDENEIPGSYKKALENQLTNKFNSKVKILSSGSRGKIEIEYYSFDDLERLVSVVMSD